MHSFKKVIAGIALFLAFTVCATCFVAAPAFMPDSLYNDSETRAELAGSLDTLCCGASHAIAGFVPQIIDETAGTNSYNLSSYAATFTGKQTMLQKELQRNPVKTVVLEIGFDSIITSAEENATGEAMIICKLDTFGEKLAYLTKHAPLAGGRLDNVYAMFMRYGLNAWKAKLSGNVNIPQSNRGYVPTPHADVSIQDNAVKLTYNSKSIDTDFSEKIFAQMTDIAEMCRNEGAELVVAIVPISDAIIWQYDNLDVVRERLEQFCSEQECVYLDLNLVRERETMYSDSISFSDESHLCDEGAQVFSREFAEILKRIKQGESIDELFCASYDEVKQSLLYATALTE